MHCVARATRTEGPVSVPLAESRPEPAPYRDRGRRAPDRRPARGSIVRMLAACTARQPSGSTTRWDTTMRATAEDLINRAIAETGLRDFGADGWQEGLHEMVRVLPIDVPDDDGATRRGEHHRRAAEPPSADRAVVRRARRRGRGAGRGPARDHGPAPHRDHGHALHAVARAAAPVPAHVGAQPAPASARPRDGAVRSPPGRARAVDDAHPHRRRSRRGRPAAHARLPQRPRAPAAHLRRVVAGPPSPDVVRLPRPRAAAAPVAPAAALLVAQVPDLRLPTRRDRRPSGPTRSSCGRTAIRRS